MMGAGDPEKQIYSPPEWLDQQFLQDVLREYFKNDTVNIIGLKVEPMTSAGYASEMHRASFQLSRNDEQVDFSVIIKVRDLIPLYPSIRYFSHATPIKYILLHKHMSMYIRLLGSS